MFKKIVSLLFAMALFSFGQDTSGTFSANTGIIATDTKGKTYDIDALIASGKHIVVHQTFAG